MAIKKTDTAHYASIADAIRAKTGGAATMTPAEMPGEIASIPAPPERYIVFDYDDTITDKSQIVAAHMVGYAGVVPDYQFCQNQAIVGQRPWNLMSTITADNPILHIGSYACSGCTALANIDLSAAETILAGAFLYSTFQTVNLPAVSFLGAMIFRYNEVLSVVRIGANIKNISINSFVGCTALTDLYIDQKQSESPVASGAPWGAPNNPTIHWQEE